jgi:hypothetical protein
LISTRTPHPISKFDTAMLDAVDEALGSLGDKARETILFHLEKKYALKRNEIPANLETFANAIEAIFGEGAKFLELLIMKKFQEKIGRIFKMDDADYAEYIIAAADFSKKIMELSQYDQTETSATIET